MTKSILEIRINMTENEIQNIKTEFENKYTEDIHNKRLNFNHSNFVKSILLNALDQLCRKQTISSIDDVPIVKCGKQSIKDSQRKYVFDFFVLHIEEFTKILNVEVNESKMNDDNTELTNTVTEFDTKFINQVAKKFVESNYNVDFLCSFEAKNPRWNCKRFIQNLCNRELSDKFNVKSYLNMLFSIMTGQMPFKKVHESKVTEQYNAFTSNLFEIKSTCDKKITLDDSLIYNKDNYMTHNKFELCEYIVTDYQRFVFDIDVEFKKIKKVKNGEDIVIVRNYNDETLNQLECEIEEIKQIIFDIASENDLNEPQFFAYVLFGTDEDDIFKGDLEQKQNWCENVFSGIECIYECNPQAKKVISVHMGVSNLCYDRIQNDSFRKYLNTHVCYNENKFEMVDSTIYNKTQHAWRFAYSRKNTKRVCHLSTKELTDNKDILYNLFAYPEPDDVIVNIPEKYLAINEAKDKERSTIINSQNPIKSYYELLAFNSKEVELIHSVNQKILDDFIKNPFDNDTDDCQFNNQIDPRLLHALKYVKKNNVGYPNIRKAIFNFVNIYRNYYSDKGECIELLLNIEYHHTNGDLLENQVQSVSSLVNFAWKFDIKPIPLKYDLSVFNQDTVRILSNAVWKEVQLKHYLRQMMFKVFDTIYIKTQSSDPSGSSINQFKYIPTSYDKLNNLFNCGFKIMKRIKKDGLNGTTISGIRIYQLSANTFIRRILLNQYSGIEIAHIDSYNFKNLYDKAIGISKEGDKIYNLKYKNKAIHDLTPNSRPIEITNILKSILNNNELEEEQLMERINYFESLFAYKVQNPDIRVEIAPIIVGKQGIGKNTYFKILKQALGNWVQDDLSWDIARGNFNANQQMNIIRAYDEVTSTKSALDLMKRLITADTEDVNEKYEKQLKIKNISLKCFLTNNFNNNIISKTEDNRRFLYYLPSTPSQVGQQIVRDNWWNKSDNERKILGKKYFNYLLRLDLSNFNRCVKPNIDYLDDMKEFIDSVNISADSTTQFIDQIISLLEIPEISKMTFIPSQLVIDLGLMCKKGNTQLGEFEFDFTSLTEWYHSNISADYTWNYKSLHNRLVENDSKYKPKIVKTTKILKHITKNKDILESYLDTQVRGYYI